jgi:hypothetical protein
MNVYIYDDFLNKGRYSRTIGKVEIRLTDLGLNGKIIRLGAIKNSRDIIQNEIKNGARNITAVGNNYTINKVINAIVDNDFYDFLKEEIMFSVIPIGSDDNSIAQSIGIKDGENACNIILARRIEKLSLGEINGGEKYFLSKANIHCKDAGIKINGSYNLMPNNNDSIRIINLASDEENNFDHHINPKDEILNIIIGDKAKKLSIIKAKQIELTGGEGLIDETVEIKNVKQIKISSKKLKIIVGKDRSF